MRKDSSHRLQGVKRAAAFWLRQLLDELGMLIGLFPDFRDAFDPDELPIEFILKRDSQTELIGKPLKPVTVSEHATNHRMLAHAAEHRGGHRKQI